MKKQLLTIGTVATITLTSVFFTSPASAEKTLNEVKNEQKEVTAQLTKAEARVAKVLLEMKEINDEINHLNINLLENEKEAKALEKKIKKLEKEIPAIQQRIEERNEKLKERLASYQENGGNAQFMEVLFGATNPIELLSRADLVSTITNADLELIEENEKEKAEVEEKIEVQKNLVKDLEIKIEEIKIEKEQKVSKQKELKQKEEKYKNEKQKLQSESANLKSLEKDILASLAAPKPAIATKNAEQSNNTMNVNPVNTSSTPATSSTNDKMEPTKKAAVPKSTGKFMWPANGKMTSGYGSRTHPITGQARMHYGIDISNSMGTPIYAAESGVVSAAKSHSSYGNHIMINHGSVTTLYAHLSSMNVSPGQSVEKGQIIGRMGATGNVTGVHLHFEVYPGGYNYTNAVNPMGYLN